jgi:hypothetical protein
VQFFDGDGILRSCDPAPFGDAGRASDPAGLRFAFGDNRQESFVIVTYADGTTVYGFFGANSLAASDGERSDLYLERLYDVREDGTWVATVPEKSALLVLRDLRTIEFIPTQAEAQDERKAP